MWIFQKPKIQFSSYACEIQTSFRVLPKKTSEQEQYLVG